MTMGRVLFATMLALLVPAAAHAQRCGPDGTWAAAAGGIGHYGMAGGTDAVEVGADVGFRVGATATELSYRRVMPDAGRAEPDVVRLRVAVPLARRAAIGVCAVVHAGGSRFAADPDDGTVVAGGLGLRLEAPMAGGRVLPFVEARGLGATLSGELLGTDVSESGAALGGEAGIDAATGPLVLRAAVSLDGFDGGLGVTPYPDRLLRLAVGFRF